MEIRLTLKDKDFQPTKTLISYQNQHASIYHISPFRRIHSEGNLDTYSKGPNVQMLPLWSKQVSQNLGLDGQEVPCLRHFF